MSDAREPFWNKNGCCNDCGGTVEYWYSMNKMVCDTCENEMEEIM